MRPEVSVFKAEAAGGCHVVLLLLPEPADNSMPYRIMNTQHHGLLSFFHLSSSCVTE